MGQGTQKVFAVTDVLSRTDQIKINDVLIGATTLDTAQAKADAINAVSAQVELQQQHPLLYF